MNRIGLVAVVVASLASGGLAGAILSQSAKAEGPAYKVTQTNVQNAAQLEKFLNEHAAAGWRYFTDIDKKLFIFEKK